MKSPGGEIEAQRVTKMTLVDDCSVATGQVWSFLNEKWVFIHLCLVKKKNVFKSSKLFNYIIV